VDFSRETAFDLDAVMYQFIRGIQAKLQATGGEVAHLKVIGTDEGGAFGVANLVSSDTPATVSLASHCKPKKAHVIVNARVAMDPMELETVVKTVASDVALGIGLTVAFGVSQSLRPGRPTPTHRYSQAK
jgi:hypothetical protein